MAVIVASMATLPGRRDIALRAVASLLPQVDALYIWLDKHTADEAADAKRAFRRVRDDVMRASVHATEPGERIARPVVGFDAGDRGDGGKFYPLPFLHDDDVWLICDDDLELPPDYVSVMLSALHRAEGKHALQEDGTTPPVVVGLHALHLPERCTSYRHQRSHLQHCLRYHTRPAEMRRAHVLGTSSVVTRPRYLRGFEAVDVTAPPNVGDLHLAAWCERQGIPRYCLPLPRERWLTNLLPGDAPSIWDGDASGGRSVQVANEDAVVSSVEWGEL